jgi:hypothetical protein
MLLYRGDDTVPEKIFNTGFKSRVQDLSIVLAELVPEKISSLVVDFAYGEARQPKVRTKDSEHPIFAGPYDFQIPCSLCLTEDIDVASMFPLNQKANTYIYCVWLDSTTNLETLLQTYLSRAKEEKLQQRIMGAQKRNAWAKEHAVAQVPPRNIVGALPIERLSKSGCHYLATEKKPIIWNDSCPQGFRTPCTSELSYQLSMRYDKTIKKPEYSVRQKDIL